MGVQTRRLGAMAMSEAIASPFSEAFEAVVVGKALVDGTVTRHVRKGRPRMDSWHYSEVSSDRVQALVQ